MPKPLKRAKQTKPDLDQIDTEIRVLLVMRAMLSGAYLKAPASLSRELEAFEDQIADWEREHGRNFAENVREGARMSGKHVPYKEPLMLPRKAPGRKRKEDAVS